jgi:acyl carrier protein
VIPFSSLILLGVVVAVEDRFRVTVTRQHIARAFAGGSTLSKLAALVGELQGRCQNPEATDAAALPAGD